MQINFTGHHLEVTDALKTFTEEKLGKLERHFDRITAIHVTFTVQKLRQIVEVNMLVVKGELHASAESDSMYTAVDEVLHKLDRQLVKHKEKMRDHRE